MKRIGKAGMYVMWSKNYSRLPVSICLTVRGSPNSSVSWNTLGGNMISVYIGLNCNNIMFEGQVDSTKTLNILYDDIDRYYHVISNLTAAMARRCVCNRCHKSRKSDVTHACDQKFSDCMACPPCAFSNVRIPCLECNRHFRNHTCFANHKQSTKLKRPVCERKRYSTTCGCAVTQGNHDCNKRYCDNLRRIKT